MSTGIALLGEVDENPLVMSFEVMQEKLVHALRLLNDEHRDALILPLEPPGSFPEFVALLHDWSAVYPLARSLAERFHPLPVHIAATEGEVNLTPGATENDQADGPAFDRAAELLYLARKEDRFLPIEGVSEPVDTLANALFLVLYRDLQSWTGRQCEIVRLYRRFGRQADVATELEVSQQSISSSLAAARWKTLLEAESALQAVLGPVRLRSLRIGS